MKMGDPCPNPECKFHVSVYCSKRTKDGRFLTRYMRCEECLHKDSYGQQAVSEDQVVSHMNRTRRRNAIRKMTIRAEDSDGKD